jgi:hypothetical protein
LYQAASVRCLCNRCAERVGLDEVREAPPPVDLDHRDPLTIRRFERLVAGNVDLTEVEVQLLSQSCEDVARTVAQMATRRAIEDDLGYG